MNFSFDDFVINDRLGGIDKALQVSWFTSRGGFLSNIGKLATIRNESQPDYGCYPNAPVE